MQDRTLETMVMSLSNERAGRVCFLQEAAYFDWKYTWCHVWRQDGSQNLSFVCEGCWGLGIS